MINASQNSKVNETWVSTDDPVIKSTSLEYGCKVIDRPSSLASDHAKSEDALIHFAKNIEFDILIFIQPTSPLLTSKDINGGLNMMGKYESVFSAYREHWLPRWNKGVEPIGWDIKRRPMRQEIDEVFVENGAFYITSKSALENTKCRISGKTIKYEMSDKTYYEIDEEIDWIVNEAIMKNEIIKLGEKKFSIKLFATDVDGVLTDSGMYYSENGDESKKFNTRDGKGIEILRENKIKTAIITSENTKLVYQRGKKLKFDYIEQGINNKLEKVKEICKTEGIGLHQVAFIGDDVNDTELLKEVGFSGVPSDAHAINIQIAEYVCKSKGGHGCVREFIELITNQLSN